MKRRSVLVAAVSIVLIAILFLGVFPTRKFLDQRAELAAAEEELRTLEAANDALEEQVDDLGTPEAVERLAREHFNLVFPGEEAYALLPEPPPPIPVPDAWPFRSLRAAVLGDDAAG